VIKDLSGLYYSAMDIGITRKDIFRFIKIYTGLPLREALTQHLSMWRAIEEKANKLYQRMERKAGRL
ncbi:MAG: lipopolysaccharide core heptose(I) kinase RfaP, partial [Endozoicomonas sp.]